MSLMIHIFIHFHIIGRIVEQYLFIFQKSLVYFWLKAGYLLNIQTQRTSLNQFEVSRTSVLFYERLQDNLFWVSPKKPKEIRTWIYQGEGPKQVRFLGEKQRWKIKHKYLDFSGKRPKQVRKTILICSNHFFSRSMPN